jgi:riboflavin kinase/FMN adenylyltransferase
MNVYHEVAEARSAIADPVATVGNFDGVHRGHRAILDQVIRRSRDLGGASLVITFDPHPLKVLAPERAPKMILTPGQKLRRIEAAGIGSVLIFPFDLRFASITAEAFVNDYLARGLGLREVYVGANFNFGRGRAGNADLLVRLCSGLGMTAAKVEEIRVLGSPISSSRIRRAVQAGEVELAGELLGRPFAIEGTVGHGAGRGAALGFPTANMRVRNELLPQDGVYVTRAIFEGRSHQGVTNIGSRPTFENQDFAVETHLLDAAPDLYGRDLEIEFLARLRQELRFESTQALVEQVRRDVERAREFFAKMPPSPEGPP